LIIDNYGSGRGVKEDNIIREKSYQFALRVIKLYQYITDKKFDNALGKQVLRSGTSIGALVEEAIQGESRMDFIHKLSIANKEANETLYWLRLLKDSDIISEKPALSMIKDCTEIIKLLTSIINTTKRTHVK